MVKGDISIDLFNRNFREGDDIGYINPNTSYSDHDFAESLGNLGIKIQDIIAAMTRALNQTNYGDCLCYSPTKSVYLQFSKSCC